MRAVLALDTSGPTTFVALRKSDGSISSLSSPVHESHGEQLSLLVEGAFRQSQAKFADIDYLVWSQGPGSFTGLKIGLSFCKALSQSLSIPILSIDSLLASAYEFAAPERLLFVLSDARRSEVFCAAFLFDEILNYKEVMAPNIAPISEVWSIAQSLIQKLNLAESQLSFVSQDSKLIFQRPLSAPTVVGSSLIALSDQMCAKVPPKYDFQSLLSLEPNYLRKVSAKTIAERHASVSPPEESNL